MKSHSRAVYSINPSVDIYKIGEDQVEFYFITTRRRILLDISPTLILALTFVDGRRTLDDIGQIMAIDSQELAPFFDYLLGQRVLLDIEEEIQDLSLLAKVDLDRYDRQINYFRSAYSGGAFSQTKLLEAKVVIFGLGAIGSGIALQLAMAGVRHFILIDGANMMSSSQERHYIFSHAEIGRAKVDIVAEHLSQIDPLISSVLHKEYILPDTDLGKFLADANFIINTLDEPYIGFTSAKIGRVCVQKNLPLFVAGGFDAHLMSTGELIIPGKTPCVDCYLSHFTTTLAGWKPRYNIPPIERELYEVKGRDIDFHVGGLASMALFSISYATITIIDYIVSQGDVKTVYGRGECLFEDLNINYLNVQRDPKCPICSVI